MTTNQLSGTKKSHKYPKTIYFKLNNKEHFIYVHAFWDGFTNKPYTNSAFFFGFLFKYTPLANFEFTNDFEKANVLFEAFGENSLVHFKPWKYKINYSGEPLPNNPADYDLVLCSKYTRRNVVDLPFFVYFIYCHHLLNRLIESPRVHSVPSNFCCFIVSNGGCETRNKMFHVLSQYKRVDSWGKHENNMGQELSLSYWTDEYRAFLSNYKFIICFENSKLETYITEKIVNPYLARTVPIYWGSHHVKNVFNMDSMIFLEDESDASFEEVKQRVIELDTDDDQYLEFANRLVFNQLDYWATHYSEKALIDKINAAIANKQPQTHA
jgi:hypothetical protein